MKEQVMPGIQSDRDEMARSYADRHLRTDAGIRSIYYLPSQAADREIQFIEINELLATRDKDPLEPIDFDVNVGAESSYSLFVLDVTPSQWEKIQANELPLPDGWTLDGAIHFTGEE